MSKQIVISGNRVLAYGEDCFAVTGNTVVCTDSEKVYNNATIATVDEIPADIDTVGYEYHAGLFVPCAPFGRGTGNIAVVCSHDCKALKDSGIDISEVSQIAVTTYTGTGTSPTRIVFDTDKMAVGIIITGGAEFGVANKNYCLRMTTTDTNSLAASITQQAAGLQLYMTSVFMNTSGVNYTAIAFLE